MSIRKLMEEFWIIKEKNPELYREIYNMVSTSRKNTKEARSFITTDLGYTIKDRDDVIRVIKRPNRGKAKPWMGIQDFKTKDEYVMFTILLDFLRSESEPEFIFATFKDYLDEFGAGMYKFDWIKKTTRYQLKRVLDAAESMGLITCIDGNVQIRFIDNYADEDINGIALYENNNLVDGFLPNYTDMIFEILEYADFERVDLENISNEFNQVEQFINRELLLTPSFHCSDNEDAFLYLKEKPRVANSIRDKFLTYMNIDVVYSNSGAYSLVDFSDAESERADFKPSYLFSPISQLNKIIMEFNRILREYMANEERLPDDTLRIPEERFFMLFEELYKEDSHIWSDEYKDKKSMDGCYQEVKEEMTNLKFIKQEIGYITLMPQIAKVIGTINKKQEDILDNQISLEIGKGE